MSPSSNSDVPLLTQNAPPTEASPNGISRRTVIKAGWIVPTVVALELSGVKQAFAQSNTGGGGNPPPICDCSIAYWTSRYPADWPAPYNENPAVSKLLTPVLFTMIKTWNLPAISDSYTLLDALSDPAATSLRKFLKQFVRLLLCIKKAGSLTIKIDISVDTGSFTKYNFKVDSGKVAIDFIGAVGAFLWVLVFIPNTKRDQALEAVAGEFAKKNISLVCAP